MPTATPSLTSAAPDAVAALPQLRTPTAAPVTLFTQATAAGGDRSFAVETEVVTTADLNVRTYPSLTASEVRATMPRGTTGTVRTSFLEADGYHWQVVSFANGTNGWVAVEFVTDDAAAAKERVPGAVPPTVDGVPPITPTAFVPAPEQLGASVPVPIPAAVPAAPARTLAEGVRSATPGTATTPPPVLTVATPGVPAGAAS